MSAVYCNRCGCENTPDRGACLRCLNLLQWPAGGNTCDNCGADNAGHADYCFNCGRPLGDVEPAENWSLAAAVSLVLAGEVGAGVDDSEYLGLPEGEPEEVPELDFDQPAEEAEPSAEAAAAEPPLFEPAEPEAEEEILEIAPAPTPSKEEPEDAGLPDSEFATLAPEDLAPEANAEDLEALALELAGDSSADEPADFAPPPPPPPEALDLSEVDEEAKPEAPAKQEQASDEDDDSVLGGWALELDDE